MRKYLLLIITFLMIILIPNRLYAESITITQEDFDESVQSGNTVKGISCDSYYGCQLASGDYILDSDINAELRIYDEEGTVTLDLNGHTISSDLQKAVDIWFGNLIINGNGSINGHDIYGILNRSGSLTINGRISVNAKIPVMANSDTANITINNGSYTTDYIDYEDPLLELGIVRGGLLINECNNLEINGGSFNGNAGLSLMGPCNNITITGGSFVGYSAGLYISSSFFTQPSNIQLSGGTFSRFWKVPYGDDLRYSGAIVLQSNISKELITEGLNSAVKNNYKIFPELTIQKGDDDFCYSSENRINIKPIEEPIILTQEDFDNAKSTGEEVKGINYLVEDSINVFTLNDGEYKLGSNINLSDRIAVVSSTNVILDLNNKKIIFDNLDMNDSLKYYGGLFAVGYNSELIINGNGEVRNNTENSFAITASMQGVLKINGGDYYGDIASVFCFLEGYGGGKIVINDGYFEGNYFSVIINAYIDALLSGGTFKANENGYGAFVFDNSSDDIATQLLNEGYVYSDEIEYSESEITLLGNTSTAKYTQKQISVMPINGEYRVIKGDNQTYSNQDLVIESDGNYYLFDKLLIDNNEVDKDNYTVERGSTIVTIKSSYLDTLSEGNHDVTLVYLNGELSTNFTISNIAETASNNPQTIDNIYIYISSLISSLIMLIRFSIKKTY